MWDIDVSDQTVTVLLSRVLGVAVCILYDIFRSLRRAVNHNAVAVFLEDILFWVLAAFLNFVFFMSRTGGGLRGYVFAGEAMGFAATRMTVSRGIVFLLSKVIEFTVKLHSVVSGKISDLLCTFWGVLRRFFAFLIKKLKRVAKRIKKLLKSRAHLLYTDTKV